MSTYLIPDQNTCYQHTPINLEDQIQDDEHESYIALNKNLDHLLATLPKDKGWRSDNIFLYKNTYMVKFRVPISFNEAYEAFCNGVSEYGPFWDHVLGYWKASKESPKKILFLKYEDMKKEPELEVNKGGGGGQKFTAKVTVDNETFFRKGVVGDWENYLTEEMKDRIDSITINKLKDSGLTLGLAE
ncbi:cytosolic sulfotransferase 5-like protein [Tanacetum coccineum]